MLKKGNYVMFLSINYFVYLCTKLCVMWVVFHSKSKDNSQRSDSISRVSTLYVWGCLLCLGDLQVLLSEVLLLLPAKNYHHYHHHNKRINSNSMTEVNIMLILKMTGEKPHRYNKGTHSIGSHVTVSIPFAKILSFFFFLLKYFHTKTTLIRLLFIDYTLNFLANLPFSVSSPLTFKTT